MTVAHEVHVPFEQLHDLAISKMEIERKIGHLLSQTVRPGRHAQMCPRGTFDEEESDGTLPSGINRKQSARYQQLAAVPEADLADYFAQSKRKQQVPSTTGFLRLTRKGSPQKKQPPMKRASGVRSTKPSEAVLDAVERLMDVDVCVGEVDKSFRAGRVMNPSRRSPSSWLAACSSPRARLLRSGCLHCVGRTCKKPSWFFPAAQGRTGSS